MVFAFEIREVCSSFSNFQPPKPGLPMKKPGSNATRMGSTGYSTAFQCRVEKDLDKLIINWIINSS